MTNVLIQMLNFTCVQGAVENRADVQIKGSNPVLIL